MRRSDAGELYAERAFKACVDAAADTFAETTGLSRPEFEAVALVELADRLAQSEPLATVDLLRKLADVIDPTETTSWLVRKWFMQDAVAALRGRVAQARSATKSGGAG